jgi:hypothetical protein
MGIIGFRMPVEAKVTKQILPFSSVENRGSKSDWKYLS